MFCLDGKGVLQTARSLSMQRQMTSLFPRDIIILVMPGIPTWHHFSRSISEHSLSSQGVGPGKTSVCAHSHLHVVMPLADLLVVQKSTKSRGVIQLLTLSAEELCRAHLQPLQEAILHSHAGSRIPFVCTSANCACSCCSAQFHSN
jgi:hypothetical protein